MATRDLDFGRVPERRSTTVAGGTSVSQEDVDIVIRQTRELLDVASDPNTDDIHRERVLRDAEHLLGEFSEKCDKLPPNPKGRSNEFQGDLTAPTG